MKSTRAVSSNSDLYGFIMAPFSGWRLFSRAWALRYMIFLGSLFSFERSCHKKLHLIYLNDHTCKPRYSLNPNGLPIKREENHFKSLMTLKLINYLMVWQAYFLVTADYICHWTHDPGPEVVGLILILKYVKLFCKNYTTFCWVLFNSKTFNKKWASIINFCMYRPTIQFKWTTFELKKYQSSKRCTKEGIKHHLMKQQKSSNPHTL